MIKSLGDIWLRWDESQMEKLQKEHNRMRELCKEAADVIAELQAENSSLRANRSLLKSEVDQLREELNHLTKSQPQELKPSVGFQYTTKTINVTENKFGIFSEGTKEINILQQWFSVDGTRENSDGEWRDVPMSGSLY
jgi:predicted nuclease with TOPRIM domain